MKITPRLAALRDEHASLDGGCQYLDDLAAAEGNRALTADEQTKYDDALTRMGEIASEITTTLKRHESLDANAEVVARLGDGQPEGGSGTGAGGAPLGRANLGGGTPYEFDGSRGGLVVLQRSEIDVVNELGHFAHSRGVEIMEQLGKTHQRHEDSDGVLKRALQHGVSSDGISPVTIEGDLVNFVDANRYAVNAARKLPMPMNRSQTFKRPRVTTHTQVDTQAAQGDVLASRRHVVTGDTVTKQTEGGTLALSEQEIDWTDPAMLGLAIQDLAEQYAIDTDTKLCTAIEAKITSNVTPLADDAGLGDFYPAFATAVGAVYTASKKMPNVVFASVDRWVALNSLVDGDGRPAFPVSGGTNVNGSSSGLTNFGGINIAGLPVVVDPNFSAGTLIVGVSQLVEFYEQNKGLLNIDAPTTLEVIYAYRGYIATNVYAQGLQALAPS